MVETPQCRDDGYQELCKNLTNRVCKRGDMVKGINSPESTEPLNISEIALEITSIDLHGIDQHLNNSSKEQNHTGTAEGGPALFLLLHRETSLHLRVDEPHGQAVGVLPF